MKSVNRHTSTVQKKMTLFVAHLAQCGCVTEAAKVAGWSRRSCVYELRNKYPEFAQAWDEAREQYLEKLEKEADRRALDGVEEPVFYQGERVDTVRRYSDTLLIFRLKALRPEKYRDNVKIEVDSGVKFFLGRQPEAISQGKGSHEDSEVIEVTGKITD